MSDLAIIVTISTVLEFNPLLQTLKSYKAKKVDDVSLGTFLLISTIGALWLTYGVSIHNVPLIVGNVIKLFSAVSVVAIIYKYKRTTTLPASKRA